MNMKKEIWIVAANSAYAKIYKAENNHKLVEVAALSHPESRLHDRDLVSSRPGITNSSLGARRSSMEPQTTPKEQEIALFAKQICQYLDTANHQTNLNRIYLTASPAFLGILRQHLSASINHLIAGEVDRDLTHLSPEEIRGHLPPVL
jgi:protein required for attachment to host cells